MRSVLVGKKSETSLVFPNEAGKPNQHLLRDLQALTPNDKPFHTELHKLRKTWATRLAHAGMSLDVLQKRLGHKNLSTTQKYLADVDLSSKEHTDHHERPAQNAAGSSTFILCSTPACCGYLRRAQARFRLARFDVSLWQDDTYILGATARLSN